VGVILVVFPKNDVDMRALQSRISALQNNIRGHLYKIDIFNKEIHRLKAQYDEMLKMREIRFKRKTVRGKW
jgi:hypothetical protein